MPQDIAVDMVLEDWPCPFCGDEESIPIQTFQHTGMKVVGCIHCGMMRLQPRPAHNELNRIYPPSYYPDDTESTDSNRLPFLARWQRQFWVSMGFWQRRRWLERFTSGRKLLEIGCGDGGFLAYLKERHWDVAGVELTTTGSRLANLRGVHVWTGDIDVLDLPLNHYDVIAMLHVLEHLYEPRKVLGKIRGLLKQNGILLIEVPNAGAPSARWFGHCWYGWFVPQHVSYFSTETLPGMLVSDGFEILHLVTRTTWAALCWKMSLKLAVRDRLLHQEAETVWLPGTGQRIVGKGEVAATPRWRTALIDFVLDPFSVLASSLESSLLEGSGLLVVARKAHERQSFDYKIQH